MIITLFLLNYDLVVLVQQLLRLGEVDHGASRVLGDLIPDFYLGEARAREIIGLNAK